MTTSHATQMAGIIAATTNGVGIVGVAPDAEIIPVKIFTDAGSLDFAAFIAGLDYAAAVGADVINMSFNSVLPKAGFCLPDGCLTEEQIDALATITRRAIRCARDSGATPIAAAGNNGLELDPDGPLVSFPAMTQGVIAVGALGPTGWGAGSRYRPRGAARLLQLRRGVPRSHRTRGHDRIPGRSRLRPRVRRLPCSWFDKNLTTDYPQRYFFGGGTSPCHGMGLGRRRPRGRRARRSAGPQARRAHPPILR